MSERFTMKHGTEGSLPQGGEWVRVDMDYAERARDLATVGVKAVASCPNGHSGSLRTHTILANGNVEPSYLCLHAECGFHEWVWLEGWNQ